MHTLTDACRYVQSLAEHFSDPTRLQGVDLLRISEEELSARLTAVKGLGSWSVEMFLMFKLQVGAHPNFQRPFK